MAELAQEVPDRLDELIHKVASYNPQADFALIRSAYEYAAGKHGEQKRLSGEPFVSHPLAVATIAAELKLDVPSIVTALLHDVVEDTATPLEEVRDKFGPEVAELVDGMTKVSKITFQSREEKQAENFRKMIIAMSHDIRVVLIKLSDRLHNMRTLDSLSIDRQGEISRETLEIYAPIAHRLGIYWLKSELEDNAFRYLNPPAYSTLKAFVAKTRKEREEYIRDVIAILSRRLEESGVKAEVTGRPKHFYSIHGKMSDLGLAFEQIYDLVAFRIIVATVRECYEALGVVHANWKPVPGRFKDYIALPKANMYQSLHTTLIGPRAQRMEVQIRTAEMHRVAEEGIAAHWSYKGGNNGAKDLRETERFAWLRRLIEWQQNLKDPQEFLSTVKDDLFPEEVFVFTPKGDVLNFPQGASVIDFAYRIHSQVGNHLSGARINGRMVPLRQRLRSGDTVEVVTSERQMPGKDWGNYCVTARAKSRIRQWLRAQEAERSLALGVSLIDHELASLKLNVAQLRTGKRFEPVLKDFSHKDVDSLLAAIGYGLITPGQLLAKLLTPDELKVYRESKLPAPAQPAVKDRGARKTPAGGAVVVSGVGDVLVRFARCCNPLPGEAITGFITRGRGVTVHLAGCPHALNTDPQRRVPVVWKDGDDSPRPIRLEVLCVDQPGLLAAMTRTIAAAGVNISTAEVKTRGNDGRALSLFEVSVTSARQLNNLMSSIGAIEGVMRVSRIGYQNGNRFHA